MEEGFKKWLAQIAPELVKVGELLRQELSDQPDQLLTSLIKIEAWYGRTGYLLAQANSWLDRAEFYFLPDKPAVGRTTELERKVQLADSVAYYREYRDKIESFHDAIKNRVNLGQSLLAYMRQNIENNKSMTTSSRLQ